MGKAGYHIADFAFRNGGFHGLHISAKAHHQAGGDFNALFPAMRHDGFAFRGSHGEGFFDEDVLAVVRRQRRLPCVAGDGRCDVNSVDFRIAQQRGIIGIRALCMVFFAQALGKCGIDLHNGNDFRVLGQLHSRQVRRSAMPPAPRIPQRTFFMGHTSHSPRCISAMEERTASAM